MMTTQKKKPLTEEQLADAKRLQDLYKARSKMLKITQNDIAEEFGKGQSAVSHYLKGVNALNPRAAAIFAKFLKVNVSDFSPSIAREIANQAATINEDALEYAGKLRNGYVPVIGEAVLGVNGSVDMIELPSGWLQMYSSDRDAYGLKVKGDSMFPRIQSGEFVLIEPNTAVHSGDEVFVRTKDGHNMIKVMTKTRDGSYQFSSVNNEHKPITLDPTDVDKMHFVSAIVKATRYLDHDDVLRQDNELE